MIKNGKITDAGTGSGIPYASVEVTDQLGTYLGAGVSADVNGNFSIDSTMMKPGTFLRISSVGYSTMSFPYNVYTAYTNFELMPLVETLPGITISPAFKANSNTLMIAGVGLALLYFLMKKK